MYVCVWSPALIPYNGPDHVHFALVQDTGFGTGPDHHATVMGTTQLNILLVLMAIPGCTSSL